MSYNQVNQIPDPPLTIKWDTTHDFFTTHYQGTAYDHNNNKMGAIVLSVAKTTPFTCCFAKEAKNAEIRFLVINAKHDEEMVHAALQKMHDRGDIDEVFITFSPDDQAPILHYMDWGFKEEKISNPRNQLVDLIYKKLGLEEEDHARRKFIYHILRNQKEE